MRVLVGLGSSVLFELGEVLTHEILDHVGQDNTSSKCTVGDVRNIFVGNGTDHDGPYDGIEMGCSS